MSLFGSVSPWSFGDLVGDLDGWLDCKEPSSRAGVIVKITIKIFQMNPRRMILNDIKKHPTYKKTSLQY